MGDRALIVTELKRALRERRLTYTDVATKLELSVGSVKRLFSTADFSLERLDQIGELLGLGLRELLERAHEHAMPANQLTLAQEREIVADPKLLFITWLVINRTPLEEIVRSYRFSEREAIRYLIQLDRLRVIELQPQNRVRLLVSRRFSWRARGPVQKYIHDKLLREFIESYFVGPQDEFFFHGGAVSPETLEKLKKAIQNAARECVEIIEQERAPPQERHGSAFILALRPWVYSGFAQYDRLKE